MKSDTDWIIVFWFMCVVGAMVGCVYVVIDKIITG